jgi:MtrB/PioB family decaheme-associated outer membrane protein
MVVMAALLAAGSPPAAAQTTQSADTPGIGSFDIGGRVSSIDGDPARFQRYRDLRDGGFLENLRYTRDAGDWLFKARLDHVGYRDQRYQARFTRFGAVKAWFEWDQVPLFNSVDTRTLYSTESPGVLRIDNSIQQGIENRQLTLAGVAPLAGAFDLQSRRDTARFGISVTPTRALELALSVTSTRREGEMPWGASFGFNNAVEVAAPIDQRSTDLNALAEWGNGRGSIRMQYDGSWFSNDVQTLVWDNPISFTDTTYSSAYVAGDGASQGRMALFPNSTLNAVSVTGTLKLPARSRATAYASVGSWNQNADLLPFTINTAIPEIPLARRTAEAKAQVTALHFTYTARPTARTWFSARYRRYDFDNQTPRLPVEHYVRIDQVIEPSVLGGTEPFGYVRNAFEADASYGLTAFAALRIGYALEDVTRTFRLAEETAEHTMRVSIDSTRSQYVSVRGVYEHSTRTGSGLDEEVLDEIGEQVSLRQFDISDRNRDRFSAVVQLTPLDALGVNGTVGVGRDDRPDAHFGLQSADTRFYSLGADLVPGDVVSAGFSWGVDTYTSLQRSRQANPGPQFDDPTRDWETDARDRVHYVSASVDLTRAIPQTDVRVAYDFNRSRSRYLYQLPPDTTLATPRQLPEVLHELHRASIDARYFFSRRVAAGLTYWFDKYDVDDFAVNPSTLSRIDLPGALLLGATWRPYTAHSVWARLSYFW